MPTITFSYKDFQELLGKKLPRKEFEDLVVLYAKGEVEGYDPASDEMKISLDDTNQPYLWCAEGMARLFKGILGIEKGIPKLTVSQSNYVVNIDESVMSIRPHIATFVADGAEIDDYLLKQLIQLQEKFCEGYGRRRQKVSIGLYSHKKITFPVHYKAVISEAAAFVPLEMTQKLPLNEIVAQHPKGKQYGWILKETGKYPILEDNKGEILSLIPIINSQFTGRLVPGDRELMFEATGTDEEAVHLAANIFAQNLYERGFSIRSITLVVGKGGKKMVTPRAFNETISVKPQEIEQLTGLALKASTIKELLEKARYSVSASAQECSLVRIPDYRKDILHVVDVIEDVAIMYGFPNIESAPLESYTIGMPTSMNQFIDRVREIAIGLGLQEIMSPILSNKITLEKKMGLSEGLQESTVVTVVEIENVMSETFSALRSWLIPILLEALSKNKHNEYPQRIFEQGLVTLRTMTRGGKTSVEDREKIAVALCHTTTDFTEIKQHADALLTSMGLEYSLKPADHPSFIKGRAGNIVVRGRTVGIIGEIHPKVLREWELEMPTTALELNLSDLKENSGSGSKKSKPN